MTGWIWWEECWKENEKCEGRRNEDGADMRNEFVCVDTWGTWNHFTGVFVQCTPGDKSRVTF